YSWIVRSVVTPRTVGTATDSGGEGTPEHVPEVLTAAWPGMLGSVTTPGNDAGAATPGARTPAPSAPADGSDARRATDTPRAFDLPALLCAAGVSTSAILLFGVHARPAGYVVLVVSLVAAAAFRRALGKDLLLIAL